MSERMSRDILDGKLELSLNVDSKIPNRMQLPTI